MVRKFPTECCVETVMMWLAWTSELAYLKHPLPVRLWLVTYSEK
jgi:hypothetical protein